MVSTEALEAATRKILKANGDQDTSLKKLRGLVEVELGVDKGTLKPRKAEFTSLCQKILQEEEEAADKDEEGSDSSEGDENTDESDDGSESSREASPKKRAKRKGKKKDSGAPKRKRTLSSYMIWMGEKGRAAAKAANPEAKVTEIASIAGQLWRAMTEADKQVYKDRAAALKEAAATDDPEPPTKNKERKKRKSSAATSPKDVVLAALHKIVRTAGIGPAVFKDLPSATDDPVGRAKELRNRLVNDYDVEIAGKRPTSAEIAKAKEKRELEVALQGIDKSNILSEGRSRRRSRGRQVSYREDDDDTPTKKHPRKSKSKNDDSPFVSSSTETSPKVRRKAKSDSDDDDDDDDMPLAAVAAKSKSKSKRTVIAKSPGDTGGSGARSGAAGNDDSESEEEEFTFD